MNKKELQSRRDFFKKAAKKTLPILALTIISPVLTSCDPDDDIWGGGSSDSCGGKCQSLCRETCTLTCATNCRGRCKYSSGK